MLPILQVGPLAIQTPGLILLAGLWIALSQSERAARKTGQDPNVIYNLFFVALISGLLVGRLAFAARYPDVFRGNLLSLFSISANLFDLSAALAAGTIAALIYGQRKQLPFWKTLDTLTPAFAVFAIAVGLAHIASGAAFGAPTRMPWGINLWGEIRHPSQIYETLLSAAILGFTYFILYCSERPEGFTFLSFLVLSAAARIFLETFRGDSQMLFGHIRTAQAVGWLVLAMALVFIRSRFRSEAQTSRRQMEEVQ